MRETALSNCEKSFVEKAILENIRVDSRKLDEFRNLGIYFGQEYGSVICTLGETRVFAQVSCEISTPKAARPNEGTIFINVEMGPMAAPHLEIGFPLTDNCIQVNRILERTLRESRCVDLESLCIIAEKKVWNLRVDISVLNHEGNVMDCSCVAAVAALANFKRPDVTTTGDGEFIIHTEKDLIPIVLHHYPICSTYALFNGGKVPVADPTVLEERVSDASLVLAINSYKEVCCMCLTGVSLTSPDLIQRCSELAATRSRHIVEFIKTTLEEDLKERGVQAMLEAEGKPKGSPRKGFAESIKLMKIPTNFHGEENVLMKKKPIEESEDSENKQNPMEVEKNTKAVKINETTVASVEIESSESSEDEDMEITSEPVKITKRHAKVEANDSSEEDETMMLK